MKVKSGKKEDKDAIVRINKSSLDMLSTKGKYYYMDRKPDADEVFYVLVDNTKGKKKLTEFDSIKKLEEAIK